MKRMLLIALFTTVALRAQETKIDRATRDLMAERVAQAIETMYIEEETAPKLAAETKRRLLTDRYLDLTPQEFAKRLTEDMQQQTGDGHLYVRLRAQDAEMPVPTAKEMAETIDRLRQMMRNGPGGGGPQPRAAQYGAQAMTNMEMYRKMNYGYVETRIMEGNIGYVRVDRFSPPVPEARAAADAAMTMIANADAVILDLRNAPGGVEAMAMYLMSFFFEEDRKPLISAYFRFADHTVASFTNPDVPKAKRRADVPLYILTSREVTFSAAELVAYSLQKFGRAKVVGENTRGGGYAVQMVPIGKGLMLAVSVGKPVHPVTKGGWQLVGVVPDVVATRDDALRVAHEMARPK